MGGKLVKDPDGAPATLTMAGAVSRVMLDRRIDAPRHTMIGTGAVMARDSYSDGIYSGTLSLVLTLADRTTLHSWMPDLAGGTKMDVYVDAAAADEDERVVLDGERVIERYQWIGPGLWSIDLPVRKVKT